MSLTARADLSLSKDCEKPFERLAEDAAKPAEDAPKPAVAEAAPAEAADEAVVAKAAEPKVTEAAPEVPPPPPLPELPAITKPIATWNNLLYFVEKDQELKNRLTKLGKDGGDEARKAVLLIVNEEKSVEPVRMLLAATSDNGQARAALREMRAATSEKVAERLKDTVAASEDSARAVRAVELQPLEGFRTFRYPADEVLAVRKEYPALAKRIDEYTDKLKELKLKSMDVDSLKRDNRMDAKLIERMETEIDPRARAAIEKTWIKMNDPEAFAKYVRGLAEDAAVEMKHMNDPRYVDAMKRGELVRNAVMRVLVKRHQAQGNNQFATIVGRQAKPKPSTKVRKTGSNTDFRDAVGQGPFFDKPFLGSRHGVDSHFLQIDYVSDVIYETTGGQPRVFWDLLGSGKGIRYWVPLFDNFDTVEPTLARPEYLAHQLSGLLDITD